MSGDIGSFGLSDKVYRFPEDLEVLDELEDVFFQVWDFEPSQQKALWGNRRWLELHGLSLEQLQSYHLRDSTASIQDWERSLHQKIQVEHQREVVIKQLASPRHGAEPVPVRVSMQPIRVRLPEDPTPRVLVASVASLLHRDGGSVPGAASLGEHWSEIEQLEADVQASSSWSKKRGAGREKRKERSTPRTCETIAPVSSRGAAGGVGRM